MINITWIISLEIIHEIILHSNNECNQLHPIKLLHLPSGNRKKHINGKIDYI